MDNYEQPDKVYRQKIHELTVEVDSATFFNWLADTLGIDVYEMRVQWGVDKGDVIVFELVREDKIKKTNEHPLLDALKPR